MIKVFISHKNTDTYIANRVAERVRYNGLEVYLDSIDRALVKDGPDLADYLLQRLGECNQLIAVISQETAKSWWVPWEIGVGSEKGFRLASYSSTDDYIPDYLKKWPVLHSNKDIDLYCEYSKRADVAMSTERFVTASKTMESASKFHKELKRALR
ncbi:MAG: TIR domain-containing protein [Gammaproteobacteria bacterium]|nr:TIR domain-containing protein [Gammaproteobacteria bacterium]MYC24495.1 TIR domain-containing protein [Gammaproteobacteria bacterium]